MKNAFKIFVPVFIFAATLIGSLFIYGAVERKSTDPSLNPHSLKVLVKGKFLGFFPNAEADLLAARHWEGNLIYQKRYQTDRYNQRIPRDENPQALHHMIFAGCSFIFGEGLDASETLSVIYQKKNPEVQSYNLGLPGGGLHTLLKYEEVFPLNKIVNPEKGYFLYFFIPQHLDRFFQRFKILVWAYPHFAKYKIESGKLIQDGFVGDTMKFFIARSARKMGLSQAIKLLDPAGYSDEEIANYALALRIFQNRVLKDLPQTKFRLVMHPIINFAAEDEKKFLKAFADQGVEVLDVKGEFTQLKVARHIEDQKLAIHSDGHPSALYNDLLSETLKTILKD